MAKRRKLGKHYKFVVDPDGDSRRDPNSGNLEFWAQDGLIALHDDGTGEFYVISCKDWLERAAALNMHNNREMYSDTRIKIANVVDDMVKAAREAQRQGDPHDPKVMEWYNKHRPKPSTLLGPMPGTKAWDAMKARQTANAVAAAH